MKLLHLTATQYIRPMSTGRNRPLLLGCESGAGDSREVVVKFRGREMDEKAQAAELTAAMLAEDLGLQVSGRIMAYLAEARANRRNLVNFIKHLLR